MVEATAPLCLATKEGGRMSKPYTLVRHLGEPGLKALEFETPRLVLSRLANRTAAQLRDLARKYESEAENYRSLAGALKTDAERLLALADEMEGGCV